ncbi:ABC transporter permease [Streptococcus cameli]
MIKRMGALLWSRKEVILANKMVVTNLLMPLLMVVLYQFMFKGKEDMEQMIFFLVLPMVPAFIGYMLPTIVSEEAEKNNQRSLRLAGVKSWEYILASLVPPFVINLIYLIALPFYLKIDWRDLGTSYLPVMLVSSIIIFLLFMGLALLVNSQSRATILAMPVMMATAFLPLFTMLDKTVEKIVGFTYMGSFVQYSQDLASYELGHNSFLVLLIWLLVSVVAVVWITKKKQVIR